MIIPYETLSSATLQGVIEEFVSREGTEYGFHDISLDTKIQQVMGQLARKEAFVIFDPESETCDIVTKGSKRYRAVLEAGEDPSAN